MFTRTLMVCLLAVSTGCEKAPSLPPAEGEVSESPQPASSAVAIDEAQLGAQLAELTQAVRKYAAEKRRVPKSLDELIPGGYLSQVPEAPAGKRFEINQNLQVYLVDN